MDLYCTVCGEPWDVDTLHDIDGASYSDKRRRFQVEGCAALGTAHALLEDGERPFRALASEALFDVLGDDVDGVASELADAEYFGLLDEAEGGPNG